ncbi:MAG: 50S ribosomal protein L4 [Nevskiaceae bacterium]|jgi:large subunit ribosomal protein L4|nr:MAG: 50S ribosomal protein L4 [Nevskiaceae bacterium]TAM23351.1 MAG: 50S ribosomal protein L4 [Nevskiaceae bacterium]
MELKTNKGESVTVSDTVFGAEYNEPLVHQIVTAYMAAGRAGTKAQKTKAEVSGGGKKPWKQKGTGRARAGSIRSPLWRGGGKTFAAKPRDFAQKVNKKMYRGAIRSIVSELSRQGHLVLADSFSVEAPKTQSLLAKLAEVGGNDILLVTEAVDKNLYLSARNIPHVAVCDVEALNPVALLRHEKVLFTREAVKKLEAWLA